MASPRTEIKPLPFPGESPTVALAMAAGRKYGLKPDDEKPARAKPRRKAAAKKKASPVKGKAAARPARKAKAARKASARSKAPRKAAAGRTARAR